jgi:hypothetical protein
LRDQRCWLLQGFVHFLADSLGSGIHQVEFALTVHHAGNDRIVPQTLDRKCDFWWKVLAWVRVDTEFQDEVGIDPVGRIFWVDAELSASQNDGLSRIDKVLVSMSETEL